MKRKTVLKVCAGVLAVFLIAGVLAVANSFMGNPVSALIASQKAQEYVSRVYPEDDWTLDRARYHFKFGEYMVDVRSKNSKDTHFTVHLRGGDVSYDDYESRVKEKWNTLSRMEEEYSALVCSLLRELPGMEKNTSMAILEQKESEQLPLELDMEFDRTLFPKASVTIRYQSEKRSLKDAAEMISRSYQLLEANGCHFSSYDLFIESTEKNSAKYLMITGCTPEDVAAADFLARLQSAAETETSHISVNSLEK